MDRLKEKYGPTCSSLPVRSARREQGRAGLPRRRPQAAPAVGRIYTADPAARQLGRLVVGQQALLGLRAGRPGQAEQPALDVAKNTELLLFWGCDQETTPWGWQGQLPSRLSYWYTELGIKQIYVCPDLNYAAAVHADRWIPVLPNTDAALYLAITYHWFKDGTYDKEYLKTHARGRREVRSLRHGRRRRRAPRRRNGRPPSAACRPASSDLWPEEWASQAHQRGDRQRRSRNPRTIRHRTGSPAGHLPGDAGTRANRASTR